MHLNAHNAIHLQYLRLLSFCSLISQNMQYFKIRIVYTHYLA